MTDNLAFFPQRARSDDIVKSLQRLHRRGDLCRSELYWTIQRSAKIRRQSAALVATSRLRNALHIFRTPPIEISLHDVRPTDAA